MSTLDVSVSAGPGVTQERAVRSDGCDSASAEAAVQRYVGNLDGKTILEFCLDERMCEAPPFSARYLCVTEDLDMWCGGAIGLFDVALARGAFARVARLAYLLEVIRHHLRPGGLLVFSVACVREADVIGAGDAFTRDEIPRTAAEYHTIVTEAGFGVEEMVDASGCVVFRARRK